MPAHSLKAFSTPRMDPFARGALRFDRHYSGGNSSRAGMFSLFYSIPATYWDAFADDHRPPLLMDLFRQYGYQLGLFASSPVYSWVVGLDRTALARVPNLRQQTHSPVPAFAGRGPAGSERRLRWLDAWSPRQPHLRRRAPTPDPT